MPDNPHTAAATGPPPAGVESCPGPEFLELHVAGASPGADVEIHLTKCPACRDQVRRIRENNTFLHELVSANASEELPRQPFAESIPGYRILSDLSAGGQGVVYKAQQLKTRRMVALKVLRGGRFATPRQLRRFEREIELAASLRHPNIVTVFESGATPDGRQYFAMELVEGTPLDKWLADDEVAGRGKSAGRRSEPRVRRLLRLFTGICAGVSYAHQRGVIHRDLKPANILIDAAGEPRILDFGLAKSTESEPLASMPGLTVAGEFAGTFAYASPEQARGDADGVDVRTDVYSLGVILYEMLSRSLPYAAGGSITDALRAIADAVPRRPSTVCAEIDGEVETILLKALSKDPDRRYQSAVQFGRDVERYLAGEPIDAKRDSTWYVIRKTARRYRVAVALTVMAFALVSAFAVAMVFTARRVARERDLARRESIRADQNAASATTALRAGNIERGRAMGMVGNTPLAEELLWTECLQPVKSGDDPSLRLAAEWALRELYLRQPCLLTRDAGVGIIAASAISPDASLIAVAGRHAPRISIWNVALQSVRDLSVDAAVHGQRGVSWLAFSPNGGALAAGLEDGAIAIWDTRDWRCERVLHGHNGTVSKVRFGKRGDLLYSCGTDGTIRIWSTQTGQCAQILRGHDGAVADAAMNPDGTMLASCGPDLTIRLWDAATGGNRIIHTNLKEWSTAGVAFSPDGKLLATVHGNFQLGLWELPSARLIFHVHDKGASPSMLVFSPDGKTLVAGSDGTIDIWDVDTRSRRLVLSGHTDQITRVDLSGDGRVLMSASNDGSFRLWDISKDAGRTRLIGHENTVISACYSADEQRLVTASGDRSAEIWDMATGASVAVLPHDEMVGSVAVSCAGLVATGAYDGSVNVWDLATGQARPPAIRLESKANSVCFSPDGQQLVTATHDGTIQSWDVLSRNCTRNFATRIEPISTVRVSPDGEILAAGGKNSKTVRLWDMRTGASLAPLEGHTGVVRCVRFDQAGGRLASTSDDRTVRLWDLESRKCISRFSGHRGRAFGVAFSPDGRMLASCDDAGEVKIWDALSGRCLETVPSSLESLFGLCFCANGRKLTTWGANKLICVIDLHDADKYLDGNADYWRRKLLPMAD